MIENMIEKMIENMIDSYVFRLTDESIILV